MKTKIFSYRQAVSFILCLQFAVFVCFVHKASAQIINTIAGTGVPGYSGDGIIATTSKLNASAAICIDFSGNVYIMDVINYRIRKVDATGIITTIAGTGFPGFSGDGGPATVATFGGTGGIVTDNSGNIYFADIGNNRIREVDNTGIIHTIAGNGTAGYTGDGIPATDAEINAPYGIAVDGTGNVFIAERFNSRVRKVNKAGIITTVAGNGIYIGPTGDGGPATDAELNPLWVATDNYGNLFISDSLDVRKVDTAGIITNFAGTGVPGYSGDGGAATVAQIDHPVGLCADGSGNVYFADGRNNRVRKVTTAGMISTIAGSGCVWPCFGGYGGDGGPATLAQILPTDVRLDCAGNIYLADDLNYRVRMISMVNHAPSFTGSGHSLSFDVCINSTDPIDSLLRVNDSDIAQTETWSGLAMPTHGTIVASGSAVNITGMVTPTGLSYTPVTGYTGNDTFSVIVRDCGGLSDTTTVYVTVNDCALATSPTFGKNSGQAQRVTVYPNPNSGTFTVNVLSDLDEEARVVITNMVGEGVKEFTASTNKMVDVRLDVAAGVYFLNAVTRSGAWSGKVVVGK